MGDTPTGDDSGNSIVCSQDSSTSDFFVGNCEIICATSYRIQGTTVTSTHVDDDDCSCQVHELIYDGTMLEGGFTISPAINDAYTGSFTLSQDLAGSATYTCSYNANNAARTFASTFAAAAALVAMLA